MKKLFVLFFCLAANCAFAQELPSTTQQQLENLNDESLEDDAYLQQLEYYRKHPINLNATSQEELQTIRFLTDLQIANFLHYRTLLGKLLDIYELQAVPGFDLITIQKITPYVFVGPALSIKENFLSRFRNGDQYVLLRFARTLETAKGFDTSLTTHYLGDANRLLLRYRFQYKNLLYYGVVADKDAGEQFFKGAQKAGFDFYSVHFFARNLGKIKALALGDYTVNLGQGLTQWQSLGFGKSADVMNIKRQSAILLPYRSTGEFYFNRGAAITMGWNRWEATAFVSFKRFSGNLEADSIDRFTSFGTSGYYRTKNEVADRNKVSDFSSGGNLTYRNGSLKLGINFVAHQFSIPLLKQNDPYNFFAFQGRRSQNASLDYAYTYKNVHLFGEFATDQNFQKAFVHGMLIGVDKKVDLSIFFRSISKSYQSLFGNAFTENTLPGNEKGVYTGLVIRPAIGWQLTAYADFYQFDFLKFRVSAPSRGWDYLTQLNYTPNKRSEVYLRYRTENKPINEDVGQPIQAPADKVKQSLRLHFGTQINDILSIKGRTEMLWFDKKGIDKQLGYLYFIEAGWQTSPKWRGNIRLQYFETAGYDSRIYVYESDVLYSFSIPAFYDKGFRYYINLSHSFSKRLTYWVRIAQTVYENRKTVGSGLDEIQDNKRTEIKLQLKYEL